MDANEKLELSAKLMTDEAIEELKNRPQAEYDSVLAEIKEGYNQAATEAATTRDAAIASANEAISNARGVYQSRMAELAAKKREGEEAAEKYYRECVAQTNATIDQQNEYRERYAAARERLVEIERKEEEERKAAEEAAKLAAEEAARKEREAEKARLAAGVSSTRKPHIRF